MLLMLTTFGISVAAGVLGSLLGLGGGIIVVPALTLLPFLGIDIRYAIGASIISVIATSSGAAAGYVRQRMTNLRVALFLVLATTSGAITGAYLAGIIPTSWLNIVFGGMLAYSALMMFRKRHAVEGVNVPADDWADKLHLHDSYYDHALGRQVVYRVTRCRMGLVLMYVAGVVSGLLGIGSGALKVPAMDLAMRLPMKVSTSTSNFMIGITAAASAGVYFARGQINPFIAAPVAVGVLLGATLGSHLLARLHSHNIRALFVAVLLWISLQMLWKGVHPGHG